MSRDTIEERVRVILQDCSILESPVEEIDREDNLFDRGLDSIQGIKLIVAIEEQFDIEFLDEDYDLNYFRNIADIVSLLQKRGV